MGGPNSGRRPSVETILKGNDVKFTGPDIGFELPNYSGIQRIALNQGGNQSGFTSGSVLFVGNDGNIAQDNTNLFWDDVNNRLGINTFSLPARNLDVSGSGILARFGNSANNTNIEMGGTRAMVGYHSGMDGLRIQSSGTKNTHIGIDNSTFGTGGAVLFVKNTTGNIGIGNGQVNASVPTQALEVSGSISLSGSANTFLSINDGTNATSLSGAIRIFASGGQIVGIGGNGTVTILGLA